LMRAVKYRNPADVVVWEQLAASRFKVQSLVLWTSRRHP
jgi:hypothetical protein